MKFIFNTITSHSREPHCHSRARGNLIFNWILAFARMTFLGMVFLCYIFPIMALASTPAQELANLLSNFNSMQANFTQTSASQQTKGQMAIQRPGKFRWQVQKPTQQLIIADGSFLWVYDADLQQATKQKLNYQQTDNPAMLLSGSVADLQKDFIITKPQTKEPGEWFTLKPKSRHGMFQVIQLQFINGILKTMHITDNLGQHSMISFPQMLINPKLDNSLFEFKPGQGVDVVEN
jgi:outer membrane lipoprotein carrier protein